MFQFIEPLALGYIRQPSFWDDFCDFLKFAVVVGHIAWFIAIVVCRARLRRLRDERQRLGERLRQVQERLGGTGEEVQRLLDQTIAQANEAESEKVSRLRLNRDGTISEY